MKNSQFFSLNSFGYFAFILAFLFVIVQISCDQKPPKNSRAAQASKGKAHFQKYCTSCHGEDGKGLIIDTMSIQPSDLTQINTMRRTNEFPILEIANMIDGRRMSKYHGPRDMPVWGEKFAEEEYLNETQIKGKLGELIAYLMSIQE